MLHGQAWQGENIYAIEIPGSVDDLDRVLKQIVQNKNPDYKRRYAPESELAAAVVNARDVAAPEDLADPPATRWIKMSEIGIDGLRQACLDPGSRIRLNSDPEPGRHSELVAMAWQGGFLDGAAIRFNSNLNVLIGGRGTGKSTVIENLRHVLGLESIGEEARSSYDGIVRNVLRNGTKISLRIRCHRPNPREYRIERTIPNPSVVRDERTGEVLNPSAADVFPGVEIYGQHEISDLAEARSAARAFRGSRRIPRLEEAGAAPAAGAIPQPDTGDPQEARGRQGGTRSPAGHRRDLGAIPGSGLGERPQGTKHVGARGMCALFCRGASAAVPELS